MKLSVSEIEKIQDILQFDISIYHEHFINKIIYEHQQFIKIQNFDSYLKFLSSEKKEKEIIKKNLFVAYSRFFRNSIIFEFMDYVLFPKIYVEKAEHQKILKIWSAGCAAGEEPYSIAILVCDLIKRYSPIQFYIAASDANPENISIAKKGIYSKEAIKNVKYFHLQQYFRQAGNLYQVQENVIKMVNFFVNDLTTEADDNDKEQFDFVFCRNVLIYFNPQTQIKITEKLYKSIALNGYLILGRTEYIPGEIAYSFKKLYENIPIYQKVR